MQLERGPVLASRSWARGLCFSPFVELAWKAGGHEAIVDDTSQS